MELLSPSITDEWGALRSAIVYPQLNYNLRCRSDRHPNLGEVGLSDLLRYHDVELVVPDMPESVACMRMFARDPITVIGRHVHGCLMRNIRNNEGQYSIDCLQSRGVSSIPWHTHGGDVLVLDATSVLVGYGPTRADNSEPWEEADESEAAYIRRHLETIGVSTRLLCHDAMHLDCAVAPLPNGEFLVNESLVYPKSVERLRQQFGERVRSVACYQELELNVLWINPQTVISPGPTYSRVKDLLRTAGYDVWHVSGSAESGGGSARCAVAPLVRDAM
jgi:N-dimethylarginine dimethylaminohydrolase